MIKYTDKTLKQLQIILKEGGYQIRKGRGAFNTGYCILEAKRVVVLNHYHSVEAKINALVEIVNKVTLTQDNFSPPSAKLFKEVWEEGKGTEALKEEETIVNVDSSLEYPDLSKYNVDAKKEKAKTEADIRAEIEAELAAKEAGINPADTNVNAEGEAATEVTKATMDENAGIDAEVATELTEATTDENAAIDVDAATELTEATADENAAEATQELVSQEDETEADGDDDSNSDEEE